MERVWIGDVEAEDEDIGVWIGERPDGVVVGAARCVPDRILDRCVVDKVSRGVLFKVGWNICLEGGREREVNRTRWLERITEMYELLFKLKSNYYCFMGFISFWGVFIWFNS